MSSRCPPSMMDSKPPVPEIKEEPVVGEFVECAVKRHVALNRGAEVVLVGTPSHGVESSLYAVAPGALQPWATGTATSDGEVA